MIKEITHWIPTPALQAQDDEFSAITPRRHHEERNPFPRHHEERGDVMIQRILLVISGSIGDPLKQIIMDTRLREYDKAL